MSKIKKLAEEIHVTGTPTTLLLPARNYKFKVFTKEFSIPLPRKGSYTDLDDKMFSEKDGEFEFLYYDEEDGSYTVLLPELSKVLFATQQYPAMSNGQAFAPLALIIKEDTVELIGNLIEMVREDN